MLLASEEYHLWMLGGLSEALPRYLELLSPREQTDVHGRDADPAFLSRSTLSAMYLQRLPYWSGVSNVDSDLLGEGATLLHRFSQLDYRANLRAEWDASAELANMLDSPPTTILT